MHCFSRPLTKGNPVSKDLNTASTPQFPTLLNCRLAQFGILYWNCTVSLRSRQLTDSLKCQKQFRLHCVSTLRTKRLLNWIVASEWDAECTGAKVVQLFSKFAALYFVFLSSSDCKCLSFLNSDLHLIYLLSIKDSFSFLPLHQLPIATPQHPVVCFWGFLNIFMWAVGITCGGGVDGWSTVSDGDSSEISKRLEVKVKESKKNPSVVRGGVSPSLKLIWGLLSLFPWPFEELCMPW